MNLDIASYLRKKMGQEDRNTLDLTEAALAKEALDDANTLDLTAGSGGPAQESPSKLRDDNTEESAISPKTHSGDSASAAEVMAKAPSQWRQYNEPPAPPMVRGASEDERQTRQQNDEVYQYLRSKMDDETRPGYGRGSLDDEMAAGAAQMGRSLAGGAGINIAAPPQKQEKSIAPELLQYLSQRQRDDAAARSVEQRATEAEGRVKAANDRLALEKYLKDQGYNLQKLELWRKQKEDESEANLRAAQAADLTAKAKARAAAGAGQGGSRDLLFDTGKLVYARPSPDKDVRNDDQKKVREKAAAWGGLLENTDKLVKDLEEMAVHPSADAQGKLRADVSLLAQGLTYAVGGGAMQQGEAERAESALGVKMTNPNALEAWVSSAMGNPYEAAREMSHRARQLRPLAHGYVSGYAKSRGFDFVDSAKPASTGDAKTSKPRPTATLTDGSKVILSEDGKSWEPMK